MASASIRHKNQASVKIKLNGEEAFDAIVFLAIGDRLIDLLNDDRTFIPVKKADGGMIIVAKTQIASIIEADADETDFEPKDDAKSGGASEKQTKKFNPYEILRLTPDASIQEVRAAYKTRIKAVHPDSIAALGLDEDLAKAALLTTQKVNYAYRKIMKDLEDAGQAEDQADQKAAS